MGFVVDIDVYYPLVMTNSLSGLPIAFDSLAVACATVPVGP